MGMRSPKHAEKIADTSGGTPKAEMVGKLGVPQIPVDNAVAEADTVPATMPGPAWLGVPLSQSRASDEEDQSPAKRRRLTGKSLKTADVGLMSTQDILGHELSQDFPSVEPEDASAMPSLEFFGTPAGASDASSSYETRPGASCVHFANLGALAGTACSFRNGVCDWCRKPRA